MATEIQATSTLQCPSSLLFVMSAEMEISLPEEDDIYSSVSAFNTPRSMATNPICLNFPKVVIIRAGRAEQILPLLLTHKMVSLQREEVYSPPKPSQLAFMSPALPDIWQCFEVSWHHLLQSKGGVMDFLTVEWNVQKCSNCL